VKLELARFYLIQSGRAKRLLSRQLNSAQQEIRTSDSEGMRLSRSFALPIRKELGSAGASHSRFGRNSAQQELRTPDSEVSVSTARS